MDYKEYREFIRELNGAGIVDRKDMAHCMRDRFDYLAEDEVEIILDDLV